MFLNWASLYRELLVEIERAAQDRGAGRAEAVLREGLLRRVDHFRAVAHPEVVVRGEVQEVLDLLVVQRLGDRHPAPGSGAHRLVVKVVAILDERLLVPGIERVEHVEGVGSRGEVEVGKIVLRGIHPQTRGGRIADVQIGRTFAWGQP